MSENSDGGVLLSVESFSLSHRDDKNNRLLMLNLKSRGAGGNELADFLKDVARNSKRCFVCMYFYVCICVA